MKKVATAFFYLFISITTSNVLAAEPNPSALEDGDYLVTTGASDTWRELRNGLIRSSTVQFHYPISVGNFPLVIFSTGLCASIEFYDKAANRIASHGFVVMVVQHDSYCWMSEDQTKRRADDIPWLIDQVIADRNPTPNNVDTSKIAMTGHSYGAATSLLVGGALDMTGESHVDERVDVVVAFSAGGMGLGDLSRPSPIPGNFFQADSFDNYYLPSILITGWGDTAREGSDLECSFDNGCREAPFMAMPESADLFFAVVTDNDCAHDAITDEWPLNVWNDFGEEEAMIAIAFLRSKLQNESQYNWYFGNQYGVLTVSRDQVN